MTRRWSRVAPFAIAALSLTACGGQTSADAPTSDSSSASAATSSSTPTAEAIDRPEQEPKTLKQLEAALPTRDEAPRGWVEFEAKPSEDTRTAEPASCLALYMDTPEQRTFEEAHKTGSASVYYEQEDGDRPKPRIGVAARTYDEPYPKEFFDTAGAVLDECANHISQATKESSRAEWHASSIPTPAVGDQSFGVRIGRPEVDLAHDYLWVRSGHTVVVVTMLTTYELTNDERLRKYAQGVLDDLAT